MYANDELLRDLHDHMRKTKTVLLSEQNAQNQTCNQLKSISFSDEKKVSNNQENVEFPSITNDKNVTNMTSDEKE